MPKKKPTNRIAGLTPNPLTGGRTMWHWKPSPRLRRHGFTNRKLGEDYESAVLAAIACNKEVEEWERGLAAIAPGKEVQRRPHSWDDAVTLYRRHPSFTGRTPKTQRQYTSALNQMRPWALDGRMVLREIDREMVLDFRNILVEGNRPYRTASLLAVLSLFLQWAEDQKIIARSPATKLKIPAAPKRRHRIRIEDVPLLEEAARAEELDYVGLAFVFGFFAMQREGDLLAATRFHLGPVSDMSPQARRVLAGKDGKVMGYALTQQKTQQPVLVPLHPRARLAIETAIAARAGASAGRSHVLVKPSSPGAVNQRVFQRDVDRVVRRAAKDAIARGDDVVGARFDGLQFRDVRRSGMCWMRDLGVPVSLIAPNSGHSIDQTQKILDTYLPSDPYSAAEGMALAVQRQAERDAEEAAQEEQG